jgi:predicted NBD/HSP70 family sugar kinase
MTTEAASAPVAATPPLLRELNERTVLERIRTAHPVSRTEIARRAGLSKPTVSLALRTLLDAGLVREAGTASGGRGRNAVLYEPEHAAAFAIGLDVRPDGARGALADLGGTVLARERIGPAPRAGLLPALAALVDRLAGGRRLEAVVAGIPGPVHGLPLGDLLGDAVGVPVRVENDVNLAALGERAAGSCQGVSDFAYLAVGADLGAGIVLGGELHRGRRNAAGELGFLPLGTGASDAGVEREARRVALAVAAIVAVLDVERIVLGGASGDLLEPVRRLVAQLLPSPPVIDAASLGDDATLAGAVAVGAGLALERAFASMSRTAR